MGIKRLTKKNSLVNRNNSNWPEVDKWAIFYNFLSFSSRNGTFATISKYFFRLKPHSKLFWLIRSGAEQSNSFNLLYFSAIWWLFLQLIYYIQIQHILPLFLILEFTPLANDFVKLKLDSLLVGLDSNHLSHDQSTIVATEQVILCSALFWDQCSS